MTSSTMNPFLVLILFKPTTMKTAASTILSAFVTVPLSFIFRLTVSRLQIYLCNTCVFSSRSFLFWFYPSFHLTAEMICRLCAEKYSSFFTSIFRSIPSIYMSTLVFSIICPFSGRMFNICFREKS